MPIITNLDTLIDDIVSANVDVATANASVATAASSASAAATSASQANTYRQAAEAAVVDAEQAVVDAQVEVVNAQTEVANAAAQVVLAEAQVVLAEAQVTLAEAVKADTDAIRAETLVYRDDALDYLAACGVLYDNFDDRYLGGQVSDPLTDHDGMTLQEGALYWDTVNKTIKVYTGLVWNKIVESNGALLSTNNLADIEDTAIARANLDVYSTSQIDAINTASNIKTKYESNADTNAFTDAEKAKVNDWIDQDVTVAATPVFAGIQLDGGTGTQGTVTWNNDEETLDIVQNGAVLQVGQETQVHVRNNTGSTIVDGTVVMATGTLGASGRITVAPANTTEARLILGIVTEDIVDGDDGKVTVFGKIRGIDTSAWNEGDILYVGTNGVLTNVKPTTGLRMSIAFVVSKHSINGTIMVRVTPIDENYRASDIGVVTQGNLSSNTVQLALEELQSDIDTLLVDIEW